MGFYSYYGLTIAYAASMACGGGGASSIGVQVVDSPLLSQQIEAQRLCIKHLKSENNRLKVGTEEMMCPLVGS